MTVPVGPNFATYIGDGITTVFAYNFRMPTLANVEISTVRLSDGLVTILTPAEYTITGVDIDNYAGGTVTYPLSGSPMASTHRIYIRRIAPFTQPTDLRNQGGYFPESVEFTFDWLEFQIQMLSELMERAVTVPPGEEGITIIPGPNDFFPQYDADGNLTKSFDPALLTSGTAPVFGVVAFGPFAADGVQTQWTLPVAPALSGNVAVFIDGVFQDYAARSVAGTTLTFTSPPPLGTTVSGYVIATASAVQIPTPGSVGAVELDAADIVAMRTVLSVYSKAETDTKDKGVKGADLASAATVDLGAATGDFVDITGNVGITSFGVAAAGVVRTVRFTGTPVITHNATSLILFSRTTFTAFNGLVMTFRSLGGGNWIEESQTPAIGTWSPGVAFGGAAVGVTYGGLNAGRYIKFGRKVSVWGCLNLSAKGSSVGLATITGLPFTIIAAAPLGVVGSIGNFANLAGLTGMPMLLGNANATTMNFGQSAAANSGTLTDTAFTNTSRVSFSMEYETAS